MRRFIAFSILAMLLLPAAAWAAPTIDEVVAGIAARYGQAKNLTVDFEQVAVVKQLGNREQRASGTITFAQPEKMRWSYTSAPAKEIITDGTSLVVHYVSEKKAYLSKSKGSFNIGLPMAILSGRMDVKEQYTPEMLSEENGRIRLKLTPKQPLGVDYLVMHVSKQGFLVEQVETVDAYGNVTKIHLNNPRFNTHVPDSTFVFVPQPGIEIIDAPMTDM